MSLHAPQQIRLRRKLDERQVGLLYLAANAPNEAGCDRDGPARPRKVFKLVKKDGGPGVSSKSEHQPTLDHDAHAEPPRYVLTQSEPSRKRKIATFTAERPQKRLQAHDGSQVPVAPPPVATAADEPPLAQSTTQRKRPGASTATSKPDTKTENVPRTTAPAREAGEDAAFKSLLEEVESGDTTSNVQPHATTKHRFLPRATTRLKDRVKPDGTGAHDAMDIDGASDAEYVYDTYVLDDAMDFDLHSAEPGSVGLLHIDEDQQPIWETYLDETDSEDERPSDDEDSNAEDYYGADYPEDELDSDDEYDVDAYKYRRGASDEEEYGPEDPELSDDDDDNKIPKWNGHPS